MRGKLLSGASRKQLHGITPADAGKTHGYGQTRRRGQDHPRGCGENPVLHDFRAVSTGSPPRMRGKPHMQTVSPISSGITPADAGKTHMPSVLSEIFQDHPRGCGENFLQNQHNTVGAGSPPRMRGKLLVIAVAACQRRITPADAGKTVSAPIQATHDKDHPRGCGENTKNPLDCQTSMGSPPRMRGKLMLIILFSFKLRITPADAGKTHAGLTATHLTRDHPRGCGENSAFRCYSLLRLGSPPRMRGKPWISLVKWAMFGITPADAGKTG